MAKMGISTLQSYKGAQIFEAVGLADEVVRRCFAGTASRVQGVGFEVLADEMHASPCLWLPAASGSFPCRCCRIPATSIGGGTATPTCGIRKPSPICKWRRVRTDEGAYWRFAKQANEASTRQSTLRGLLQFNEAANGGPIPLGEVEDGKEIVKRFATGAMSFGSISKEAHESPWPSP